MGTFLSISMSEDALKKRRMPLHTRSRSARVSTDLSAKEKRKMILEGSELIKDDRESQLYDEFERFRQIKGETIHVYYVRTRCSAKNAHENGAVLDEEQLLFLTGEQVTNFDDDVFEANQCDAFDSIIDESPTTQTMFMVNLSSEDPIYDEAGPSYDSNTPFEVQDHDTFVDHMDEYHEVHEMQKNVQHNYVVDSDAGSIRVM
ncbi:hypothetical protein Tco_0134354 [Tanacetum coccineum]